MIDDHDPTRLLNADQIRELLVELGDELALVDESGELFVVGGAALAVGYGAREATRDVDAVFEPKAAIYEASNRVARRHGLGDGWLNDAMRGSSTATTLIGGLSLTTVPYVSTSPARPTCWP